MLASFGSQLMAFMSEAVQNSGPEFLVRLSEPLPLPTIFRRALWWLRRMAWVVGDKGTAVPEDEAFDEELVCANAFLVVVNIRDTTGTAITNSVNVFMW